MVKRKRSRTVIQSEAEIRENFPKAIQLIFKRGEKLKLTAEHNKKLINVLGIYCNIGNYEKKFTHWIKEPAMAQKILELQGFGKSITHEILPTKVDAADSHQNIQKPQSSKQAQTKSATSSNSQTTPNKTTSTATKRLDNKLLYAGDKPHFKGFSNKDTEDTVDNSANSSFSTSQYSINDISPLVKHNQTQTEEPYDPMRNQQKFQMQVLSEIGKMNEKIDLILNMMNSQGSSSNGATTTKLEMNPQRIPLVLGENVFIRPDTFICCNCKKQK